MNGTNKVRAAFVMEQHLGHQSFSKNLHRFVDQSTSLDATWIPVTYTDPASFWDHLPLLPKQLRGSLTGRFQVRRGLSQAKWDVALYNTQVPAVLGCSLVNQQPYVLCTDITPVQYDGMAAQYGHRPDTPGPVQRYKHWINTRIFRNAARLLPWSNWTRSSLIADYGVSPDLIEVIPPGIDLDVWRPAEKHNSGPIRILFVGGDFYRKGGDLLLNAFKQLPAGDVELHLVTRSAIPDSGGTIIYSHMLPNSPELVRLYQECDIFVLPTHAEAFGIAAAEAAAAGLPVIATAVGGLTDVVLHGETGYLIPPGSTIELTARLAALMEDSTLRRQMGQAARIRAESQFNAKNNASRVIEILQEIAFYPNSQHQTKNG